MDSDRYSGEYSVNNFATAIAGIISVWLPMLSDDEDRLHMGRVLERHARRVRYDAEVSTDDYTIRPRSSERIPFEVVHSNGNVTLFESFDTATEYIRDQLTDETNE